MKQVLFIALLCLSPPIHASTAVEVKATVEGGSKTTDRHGRVEVDLGKPFSYIVDVTAPQGARVYVPANPDLGPVRVLDYKREVKAPGADKAQSERHIFKVMPVRIGPERVGAMEVPFEMGEDDAGVKKLKGVKIRVRGHLTNEQNPALEAKVTPQPVTTRNWALIYLIGILGLVIISALLTLLVLRILRDRLIAALPGPPPPPPHLLAYRQLAALTGTEDPPESKLSAVTDVLREYLGGRYGFDGLEMTTTEMMVQLENVDLKTITKPEIQTLLDDADLVKFAKSQPTDEEAEAKIPMVKNVVDVTWEEPEEEEVSGPQFEPATSSQRLKAGLLDVIFFSVPGIAVSASVWLSGHEAWAWLGGVVFCLLLFTRDLFGAGSPGKRLFGLKVAHAADAHAPVSTSARLGRNALLLLGPIGLPIETMVLAYNPFSTRLGDRMSDTHIVRPTELKEGRE